MLIFTDDENLKDQPKLVLYTRSELKTSDHRYVSFVFGKVKPYTP